MEYTIEKNIPIPRRVNSTGVTECLRNMEVGDSVLLPNTRSSGLASMAAKLGIKITTRKVNKSDVRVWRIA